MRESAGNIASFLAGHRGKAELYSPLATDHCSSSAPLHYFDHTLQVLFRINSDAVVRSLAHEEWNPIFQEAQLFQPFALLQR